MRVLVFKDAEIDNDGVTSIWKWECQHWECIHRTTDHGSALYWENALRAANYHIQWHQQRAKALGR